MSRVDGVAGGAVRGSARARAGASAGGFDVAAGGGAADPAAIETLPRTQAARPVGLAGMLALQEAEAETAGNRAARRHGLALLEALRQMQHGLLEAEDAPSQLAGLARLAAEMPEAGDPGLGEILSAIRLRARIELLRRGGEAG